jgi:hypothetical protein
MAQLGNATNPMTMLMGMLNPNQKQIVSQFQNKTDEEQAEQIAKMCNEKGITKEQLQSIMNMLKR